MASKNYVLFMICTTILFEIWLKSNAEVYSAVSELPTLLNTYKLVIDDLHEYIQKEDKRIFALKKNLDVFKKEHAIAMEDIPNYLGNPINAFTLIKRLTIDLKVIEDRANLTTEFIRNIINSHEDYATFPGTKDLYGAAIALKRLQDTYKLQVHELAEGKINGVPYSLSMSADDCFGMGHVLYNMADYNKSIEWTLKALSKYEDEVESNIYSFTPVDAMNQISSSYYKLGDNQSVSEWEKKSETIYPNYDYAQTNLSKLYEIEITDDMHYFEGGSWVLENGNINMTIGDMCMALCRGEYEPAPEITKRLTCFYFNKNHPFLRLAAIKTEQLYIDPDVFIFYDFLSDRETEHLKAVGKPTIGRAKIDYKETQSRVAKETFIYKEDDVTRRISQRVADVTGLSMEISERFAVINYGIGGSYIPHYDHDINNHSFYLSKVAQGGATVFTELGLSVFPVKNSAVFWMNLHPSGIADLSTMHASCPVIRGSKWISLKMIRELGQEFHRPCSLEHENDGLRRPYLPTPVRKSFTYVR